jgi:hypothetical protein
MASRKALLWTLTAASLIALPVTSEARVNIEVEIAPPVAISEAAPPREGFVWVPGYWNWDAGMSIALPCCAAVARGDVPVVAAAFASASSSVAARFTCSSAPV